MDEWTGDRRRDMTKLNDAFRNFASTSKECMLCGRLYSTFFDFEVFLVTDCDVEK